MFENLSAWRWLSRAGSVMLPRRAFVLALLDIYERDGVYIGGRLEYSEIVSQWARCGFRRGDLEAALDDAVRWRLVELVDEAHDPVVALRATQLPPLSASDWAQRKRDELANRSLLAQRARRAPNRPWSGVDRRQPGIAG